MPAVSVRKAPTCKQARAMLLTITDMVIGLYTQSLLLCQMSSAGAKVVEREESYGRTVTA